MYFDKSFVPRLICKGPQLSDTEQSDVINDSQFKTNNIYIERSERSDGGRQSGRLTGRRNQ